MFTTKTVQNSNSLRGETKTLVVADKASEIWVLYPLTCLLLPTVSLMPRTVLTALLLTNHNAYPPNSGIMCLLLSLTGAGALYITSFTTPLSGICLPIALSLFPLPALLYLRDIQSIETYTYINMHISVYFHSPFFYSLSHKFYESIFFLLFSSVLQRLESLLAHCKYSMNMCRIDK